jgi:stearoyl-CoA desaturase (delta-9 desaturase)
LEHAVALVGVCCWQGTPLHWVSVHRLHHQHSDQPGDPHTPRQSFLWSHMGWFLMHDPEVYNRSLYLRYARDLLPDRFYTWLEQPRVWFSIHAAQWTAFLLGGGLVGALATGTMSGTCQTGLSWLIWGVLARTVLIWHITWSVNSLSHVWGYRNFDTRDDSRNNWLVALVANGEGWHNNHHADPRSAAHGQRWWEFDISYLTICAMQRLGLVWDIVRPRAALPRPDERRMAA